MALFKFKTKQKEMLKGGSEKMAYKPKKYTDYEDDEEEVKKKDESDDFEEYDEEEDEEEKKETRGPPRKFPELSKYKTGSKEYMQEYAKQRKEKKLEDDDEEEEEEEDDDEDWRNEQNKPRPKEDKDVVNDIKKSIVQPKISTQTLSQTTQRQIPQIVQIPMCVSEADMFNIINQKLDAVLEKIK